MLASDARSLATSASRSGLRLSASLRKSSTMCAVCGGRGRPAALATRSFVVGGKSMASSNEDIVLFWAV